jgi:hypothetical protein
MLLATPPVRPLSRLRACASPRALLRRAPILSALLVLSACQGDLGEQPQRPNEDSTSDDSPANARDGGKGGQGKGDKTDVPPDSVVPTSNALCDSALVAPRAVLISPRQYVRVLRDLLGETAVSEADATADAKLEFDQVELPRMTTPTLDRVLRLAERATLSLKGKEATWLGCSSLKDDACVRTKLTSLARRAYKRPLSPDEIEQVMAVRAVGLSAVQDAGESGLGLALQAILTAPSTLYRTEFSGATKGDERALSGDERAAVLALLLLDSVPDPELIAAVDRGDLATSAGVEKQIDRLLALPRVREHLTNLVLGAFKLPKLFETLKDPAVFPEYTQALQISMYEEARRFVDHVLWQGLPMSDLITSRSTFVDAPLAKIYGVPYTGKGTDFVSVELPEERSGLLTQAGVLSLLARTDRTSVVARGLYVRGALLCLPKVPSPPATVQNEITAQLTATASERELADYRAKTSPCGGCHAGFDRFGLLLEDFDAIGRRTKSASVPLDFTGLGGVDGTIETPAELARRVVDDGQFEACFSERMFEYALSEASLPEGATCELAAAAEAAPKGDRSLRSLISSLVTNRAFVTRSNKELGP